uniref:Ig-like domain-containing protein n=1 Tax=Anas platyrhynchos TaxID=8839 RepID=A0A8B9QX89_ANAPL
MDYSSFSGVPRFLTRPKAFMVSVGKDATLSCQIIGNPIPVVSWEKDKLPVQSGGRFKTTEDGDLYRLTIYDLSLEDSGQYICRAKNTIGEAFAAVSIKVGEETTVTESAPYFIQKPSSIKVTLGEDAMFKCKVQGSPPLSVNWEKDGRHLRNRADAGRFQIESAGESNALTIQCARLGDSGTYTCRAENPIGSASASAALVVETLSRDYERAAGLTTKGARNATFGALTRTCSVTEGKHAKLSCYVTGEPKPEIVWKKDNEVISEGRRHVIYEDDQENFVLKILFCKQVDNGLYTCTASNLAGQTYSSVLVTVKEPSIPFKEKLKDLEVWEKESATFQCEVPVPSTETAWFKEETKLRQSKKYNIEEEGTYRRLTVQNVTADDDAVYICEMKEGSRTIAELSVQGNIIKKLPRKTAVSINDTAIFCVELDNECQNIRWLKNKEEVKASDRISITRSGKQYTMIIRECTMEDAGEIAFLADESRTSTQFTVTTGTPMLALFFLGIVSGKSCIVQRQGEVHSILAEEADYQFRVSAVNAHGQSPYLEFPGSMHLGEHKTSREMGQPVLTCHVAVPGGDAMFTIDLTKTCSGTWYLNGKVLQESETYIIKRTQTTHNLIIKNVTKNDDGAEVKFSRDIEKVSARLREEAKLQAELSDTDATVKWMKDGKELKDSEKYELQAVGKKHVLKIRNIATEDAGVYQCICEGDKMVFQLSVKDETVNFVNKPKTTPEISVSPSENLELVCEVSAASGTVVWKKDQTEVNKKFKVESEGKSRRLVVSEVEKKDAGEYTCEAISWCAFTVTQTLIAWYGFINKDKVQKEVKAALTENATLSCEVAQEKTDVKWYKEGKLITSSKKFKVESEGKSRRLVVSEVEKKDAGEYTCEAAGQKLTFKIVVTGKGRYFAALTQNATLSCEVAQEKTDVKWYKEGKLITSSKKFKVESEGKSRRLVVSEKDAGEYTCEAAGQKLTFKIVVTGRREILSVKAALTQNATLSCEVAQEKTDVKWYKEGKLITSSKKFKVESEGKSRRLVVNQLEKKDAGEYTCEAAGQKLNFKIVVTGERRHFGPSFLFLEHLQKLLLFCKCFSRRKLHRVSFKMHCCDGPPNWGNGFSFPAPSLPPAFLSSGLTNLSLSPYTPEPEAVFTNKEKVQKEVKAALTQNATLSCEVAQEKTDVKWYKEGKLITSSKKFKVESEGKSRRLVVSEVEKKDAGEYTCEAAGSLFESAPLPSIPEVEDGFINKEKVQKEVKAALTENATLSCEVAQEKTDVKWYKEGKLITSSKKFKVESEGKSRRLVVSEVEKKDAGEYTCEAAVQFLLYRMIIVSLTCEVTHARGKVVWRRNGVEIKPSKRFQIHEEGIKRTLTITGIRAEDEGEYFCESRDDKSSITITPKGKSLELNGDNVAKILGFPPQLLQPFTWLRNGVKIEASKKYVISQKDTNHNTFLILSGNMFSGSSTFFTVISSPLSEASISFKKKLEARTVEEKDTVTLEVELTKPAEVKWMRNSIVLKPSEKIEIKAEGTKHILVVKDISFADRGFYCCETPVRLMLDPFSLQPVEVSEKGTVTFEVELSHEDVEGTWQKDGVRLKPAPNIIMDVQGKKHSLTLSSVTLEDAGLISFKADGIHSVRELPVKIVKPLRDKIALEKHRGFLECQVSRANAEVRWYKKDMEIHPSDKYEIVSEGVYRKLIINDADYEDEDTYTCDAFDDKSSAHFFVEGTKQFFLPRCIEKEGELDSKALVIYFKNTGPLGFLIECRFHVNFIDTASW